MYYETIKGILLCLDLIYRYSAGDIVQVARVALCGVLVHNNCTYFFCSSVLQFFPVMLSSCQSHDAPSAPPRCLFLSSIRLLFTTSVGCCLCSSRCWGRCVTPVHRYNIFTPSGERNTLLTGANGISAWRFVLYSCILAYSPARGAGNRRGQR